MPLKIFNPTEISLLERLCYQYVIPALQLEYFHFLKSCYIFRSLIASSSILPDSGHVAQAPVGARCSKVLSGGLSLGTRSVDQQYR
jgi:hypothetical protein